MRRVVITGLGIVSSLGNNKAEVKDSLYAGKSGISFQPEYAERGMRTICPTQTAISALLDTVRATTPQPSESS